MTKMKANLAYLKLIVDDLDAAAKFYGDVCQLDQVARIDDEMDGRPMSEIILEPANEGACSLVLLSYHASASGQREQSVPVFLTDDIDAFVGRVARAGGRVSQLKTLDDQRARVAFWYDLEGNLIETAQFADEPA